jgi:death on curing protein
MTEWRWLSSAVVFAVHDRQIAEHGGADGVRDRGAVESAISRPPNLAAYGQPDAAELAAAYFWGLVRNHGFTDGNKRVAWIAARLFLADNGQDLSFDRADAIRLVEQAASGAIEETAVAGWLRERSAPRA